MHKFVESIFFSLRIVTTKVQIVLEFKNGVIRIDCIRKSKLAELILGQRLHFAGNVLALIVEHAAEINNLAVSVRIKILHVDVC